MTPPCRKPYRIEPRALSVPVSTRRRDWFRILRDLMAVGVSMTAVARKLNRDVSAVRNWANGSDPKESDARVLLALYMKYCPLKYVDHYREFDAWRTLAIAGDQPSDSGETQEAPPDGKQDAEG